MPVIRSAKKRLRQNIKQRAVNKTRKSALRTLMKKTSTEKDPDRALSLLKQVYSSLDMSAQRRIIHPNKASRYKAQLAKAVGRLKKAEPTEGEKLSAPSETDEEK
jgi:small subunit ribosomal protein S20